MRQTEKITVAGITYSKPTVVLLQDTGIGISEYAARTCYDSFEQSENEYLKNLNREIIEDRPIEGSKPLLGINDIEHSDLLDTLAWTHFHHSILEHINITYLIKGTSRSVLQEHARHRIQAISVRSTRYTMSEIINAFIASLYATKPKVWFGSQIAKLGMFVTQGGYNLLESNVIWTKLQWQMATMTKEKFYELALSKSALESPIWLGNPTTEDLLKTLNSAKKKRNIGDAFKHIVTDNWKVDMVVTFNLRSLKNYFELRSSNSAYFQIHWLADEMIKATPNKYLELILKTNKIEKVCN